MQGRWPAERLIGLAREIDNLDHRVQIERAVDVREKLAPAFIAGIKGRLPSAGRCQSLRVDREQHQVLSTLKEAVGCVEGLRRGRTVDKAFGSQACRLVGSSVDRLLPLAPVHNVEDHEYSPGASHRAGRGSTASLITNENLLSGDSRQQDGYGG
jgi:hypothetical protein